MDLQSIGICNQDSHYRETRNSVEEEVGRLSGDEYVGLREGGRGDTGEEGWEWGDGRKWGAREG